MSAKAPDLMTPVILQLGTLHLEIRPDLGGRITVLRKNKSPNLIDSRPELPFANDGPWSRPWIPWRGHVVWLGPQSDWPPHPKKTGAHWPPDPALTCSLFQTLENSETTLVLQSPISEATQTQMTKCVRLTSSTEVSLSTSVTNCGKGPIGLTIWSNTRVPASGRAFIKTKGTQLEQIDPPDGSAGFQRFDNGWGFFDNRPGQYKFFERTPGWNGIAYFLDQYCLLKTAPPVPLEKQHPEHGSIEIYSDKTTNPDLDILELEMHSEFQTLEPGEAATFEEQWSLMKVPEYNNPGDQARCIESILSESELN